MEILPKWSLSNVSQSKTMLINCYNLQVDLYRYSASYLTFSVYKSSWFSGYDACLIYMYITQD